MKSIPSPAPKQARKPRSKPQRFCRLASECDVPGVHLIIRQVTPSGKETIDAYGISECGTANPVARGFAIVKADGTVYHVECSPSHRSCDCKGGLQHGHCKHSDAIAVLLGKGELGGYPEPPHVNADDYSDADFDRMAAEHGYDSEASNQDAMYYDALDAA